jgi:diguanylate cyclase (GGDEF)-like protein
MKTGFKLLYILILALGLTQQDCHAQWKKKVLVLHSYHQGLEWTDNITKGIQSVLSPYQKQYEIHYEYLDTKRNTGHAYTEQMVKFISTQNKHINYEVIIVSDNNALKFVNDGRIHFSGSPQIVFCGINNYNRNLTNSLDQVTGVVENTDHRATIDLMRKLHPERNQIVVIVDKTQTGDAIREELKIIESLYKGELKFEFLRDFLLEEISDIIAELDDNNLIYLTTFNRDRNNNFISYTEGIEVISRSTHIPIYGSWDFYLGKGIVGGRITSGYNQGKNAANLALKILQGHMANKLEIITQSPNLYLFDYKYTKRYGIDRSSLPSESEIINLPPAPYERYRALLISITAISLCVTFIFLWKYKRQKNTLYAKQTLASQLEIMIKDRTCELENANKELLRLSNIDGLTQIYNRRYFDNALRKEITRLQRTSTPISLLMCDIDYFKNYNDTYGHLAGDNCIRSIANTIKNNSKRISDVAARFGGEEFSIILPNTKINEALSIAESIRQEVEHKMIPHETSLVEKHVTLSIGVASLIPERHTKPSTILALADKALYESKYRGRNRVSLNGQNKLTCVEQPAQTAVDNTTTTIAHPNKDGQLFPNVGNK